MCGSGTLLPATGEIKTSNFPENYNIYENCSWTISTPNDCFTEIVFLDFHLSEEPACQFDHLKIIHFKGEDRFVFILNNRDFALNIPCMHATSLVKSNTNE